MLLEASGVTVRFGGLVAVNDVTFAVDRGEVVGLVGPNGAGKTTLFNAVAGFLRPSAGRVRFDGEDITGLSSHAIAERGLARTFQLSRPFGELSVLENVQVGAWLRASSRREADAMARRALARVRFEHRADVPAYDLTAAERKRLDLARCVATEPSALFVDEVIAGCNEGEMQEILATLRELRDEGVAIVMVEHVLRAVLSVSDRVMVLESGAIAATGSPDEIRSDPRAIAVYFGSERA